MVTFCHEGGSKFSIEINITQHLNHSIEERQRYDL